jgi:hypothetical protein
MEINTIDCISKCMGETNFFNKQKKLDTVYYLMQGLTYREIAKKIDKQISYVQRVMSFLRNNGLLYWGRWSPNVYKIGMEKSIAFLDLEDEKMLFGKELYRYVTYIQRVQAEETKVLVIWTYPKDDRHEIENYLKEKITPFYYTNTRFTVPLFKKIDLPKKFFDRFDTVKNDEKIVMGNPSFRAQEVYDDPITVYTCMYAESLPELTPGALTKKLEKEFKNQSEIKIKYEDIRKNLNMMIEKGVLFPKNALYFKPLSYQSTLLRIKTKEIYKIMDTFNQFNMLTRLALTEEQDTFYLYIQYPFHQFTDTMEILDKLDPDHKAYIETKFIDSDVIYYEWSLKNSLNSRSESHEVVTPVT